MPDAPDPAGRLTGVEVAYLERLCREHGENWGALSRLVARLAGEVRAAGAERDAPRAALRTIRTHDGQVCGEYEICEHPACFGSCGAWAVADQALHGGEG